MANVCPPTRTRRLIEQLAVVLIAMCSGVSIASAQTTMTLSTPGTNINADVTIQGGSSGTMDFSASPVLESKVSSEDYTRRILLKFDTQAIPANAVIQSARLYLVLQAAESAEARPLTAYHVTKSFTEGETNWYYAKNGSPWAKHGGDYSTSYGSTKVGNAVGSTYTFDLTKLVQQTSDGVFGSRYTRVALIDTAKNKEGNYRAFHSTRAKNAAQRPRLVITYGSAPSKVTPAPPKTPAPTATGGSTLRVMQWNIHKTEGSDGVCNPDRIATRIVAQNPDVVSINEVNFFSGSCAWTFDMGEKLQTLVQQKSGATWYRVDVNVTGDSRGYGNVILSRYRPVSSSSRLLSNERGVAHIGISVNGRTVNIFSTHVEYDHAAWRPAQIAEAVSWINTFAEPRIAMGDFNTNPATSDYNIIAKVTNDAWAVAKSAGTATSYNGTGATHNTSRFDYVFYSKTANLALTSVKVPDTRSGTVRASDHDPVVAVFTVK
jgi:endonuclease/exonuclease/phosphatase family metal-dependent hydrolase